MSFNPKWIKDTEVVKRDGTNPLTGDWDAGDGRKITIDELRIQDSDGFTISDSSGNSVFNINNTSGNVSLKNGVGVNEISDSSAASSSTQLLTANAIQGLAGTSNINDWSLITDDYTASHKDRLAVSTDSSAVIITLPLSPSFGDEIWILDADINFGTNNCTLDRNGKNIEGVASDYVLDSDRADVELVYINSTIGWRVKT